MVLINVKIIHRNFESENGLGVWKEFPLFYKDSFLLFFIRACKAN